MHDPIEDAIATIIMRVADPHPDPGAALVNLTPHPVTLCLDGGDVTLPSVGVARCQVGRERARILTPSNLSSEPVPVNATTFGQVTGLPEYTPCLAYIVSRVIAEALPARRDLYCVDDTVRDDQGRVIGARALCQVQP